MTNLMKEIIKRHGENKIRFRVPLDEFNKECKRLHRPLKKESNGHDCLTFTCMFCGNKRTGEQISAGYARMGAKKVVSSWMWICEDCKKEIMGK